MLYFTEKKGACTGCSACAAACPLQCISLSKDEEGFLYPVASDLCIKCGKCRQVCPIENATADIEYLDSPKAYCGVTKNQEVWQRSASGGAFSEICYAFGNEDTIVCGAAWDGFDVHHICVEGVAGIKPLCKSKYVASSPENVFLEIKNYLQIEKKVVFCGTPCQVAGLRKFLDKSYNNLLLIDFICHGVGSPDVFKSCMDVIGDQFDAKVSSYEFRTKGTIYTTDHIQKINTEQNMEVVLKNDPYIQLFLSQNCLRPSCGENCRFRKELRQGDITIADFKGLTKVFPDLLGSKKNYSSIIVNSPKGLTVIDKLSETMLLRGCDLEAIKKYNPLFYRQTWESKDRNTFFEDFKADSKAALKKWTLPAVVYKESRKRKLFNMLPFTIRRILSKIRGGGESTYSRCELSKVLLCIRDKF